MEGLILHYRYLCPDPIMRLKLDFNLVAMMLAIIAIGSKGWSS